MKQKKVFLIHVIDALKATLKYLLEYIIIIIMVYQQKNYFYVDKSTIIWSRHSYNTFFILVRLTYPGRKKLFLSFY